MMQMAKKSLTKSLVIIITIFIISSAILPVIDAHSKILKKEEINNVFKTSKHFFDINDNHDLFQESFQNIEFVPGEIIIKFKEKTKINFHNFDNLILSGVKPLDTLNKKYKSNKEITQRCYY